MIDEDNEYLEEFGLEPNNEGTEDKDIYNLSEEINSRLEKILISEEFSNKYVKLRKSRPELMKEYLENTFSQYEIGTLYNNSTGLNIINELQIKNGIFPGTIKYMGVFVSKLTDIFFTVSMQNNLSSNDYHYVLANYYQLTDDIFLKIDDFKRKIKDNNIELDGTEKRTLDLCYDMKHNLSAYLYVFRNYIKRYIDIPITTELDKKEPRNTNLNENKNKLINEVSSYFDPQSNTVKFYSGRMLDIITQICIAAKSTDENRKKHYLSKAHKSMDYLIMHYDKNNAKKEFNKIGYKKRDYVIKRMLELYLRNISLEAEEHLYVNTKFEKMYTSSVIKNCDESSFIGILKNIFSR